MKHTRIETRAAQPIETREDDPLAAAVQAVDELRTAAEEHRNQLDERVTSETRALNERLAAMETRLNRPGTQQDNENEPDAETRAFGTYLRLGDRAPADELRTLTVSGDPQGGYLAPPELSTEFIRDLVEFSPIRGLASVRNCQRRSKSRPLGGAKPGHLMLGVSSAGRA